MKVDATDFGYYVEKANPEEADILFEVVNQAYDVELQEEGGAFKKERRFKKKGDYFYDCLAKLWVLKREEDGQILGCVGITKDEGSGAIEVGPLAVAQGHQRQGHGDRLMGWAERMAEEGALVHLQVVSCRLDVIRFYERRGYRIVKTVPVVDVIPPAHLTRTDLQMHQMTKQKSPVDK